MEDWVYDSCHGHEVLIDYRKNYGGHLAFKKHENIFLE